MNITVITQPAHPRRNTYRPRFNWKPLTDSIASSEVGTWLSVPMTELPDAETPPDPDRYPCLRWSWGFKGPDPGRRRFDVDLHRRQNQGEQVKNDLWEVG